jgi:hypothetical protein
MFHDCCRLELDAYSETCEIRTSLGTNKSVPNLENSSFQGVGSTENRSLGPDGVSLFHRMSSFYRVAIYRLHCTLKPVEVEVCFTPTDTEAY